MKIPNATGFVNIYIGLGVKRVLRTNRTQYVVLQACLQTHIFVSVLPRRDF